MAVCSQNLPVVYVGDIDSISQEQYTADMKSATYDTSRKILEEWEKKHPTETTIKMLETK